MSGTQIAAEPDAILEIDGTVFVRASELKAELDRLCAARAAGKTLVVLPDWSVYHQADGFLLVLKLQFNLPATLFVGFGEEHYGRLRALIRADRFFLHADLSDATLNAAFAGAEPTRGDARKDVRERAFLVNGLADGLVQIAYALGQPPWQHEPQLKPLRAALPRVRPKKA